MQYILNKGFSKAQMVKRFSVLFAVIWTWSSCTCVHGQECYPSEVTEAVIGHLKLPPTAQFQLQATELPNLKEELIGLEQANDGVSTELRVVRFYEVTPATYQVVNDEIISVTVQLDNDSLWLVGVGPSKTIYKLAGFSDSVSEFNKLMKDLAIHVNEPERALDVFDMFLKLARSRQFFSSVIGDTMQLQSVALQDFRLRFPESKRRAAFDRWWRAVLPSLKKAIVPPKVRTRGSGFVVSYYRYSKGALENESVFISTDGSVTPQVSKSASQLGLRQ